MQPYQEAPLSSHALMSCRSRATYIVVTAVFCSRYGARFPHGAFPVCSRLFRNEPRLDSVLNPYH